MILQKQINWRWLNGFAIMGLVATPYIVYLQFVLLKDPVFKEWSQMVIWAPTNIEFFFMYGLLFIFSVCALPELIKNLSLKTAFLLSWFMVIPILINLPIHPPNIPTRLIEGYHILLSMLSALFLSKIFVLRKYEAFFRVLMVLCIVLILSLGNIWVLTRDMKGLNKTSVDYYSPIEIMQGMEWLSQNSKPDEAVLASEKMSILIPTLAGNSVFFGHLSQSIHFFQKKEIVKKFFSNDVLESERIDFFKKWQIRYLFYTMLERNLGAFNPGESPYFYPVFQNRMVKIYCLNESKI